MYLMSKLISILLSVLLLVSSTGLTYAKHYCGDFEMLAEVTFGEKQLSCGMVIESSSCDGEETVDHNCCDNEYTQIETDDNFAKATYNLDLYQPFFVTVFVSVFVQQKFFYSDPTHDIFSDYRPPPLYGDYTVLYETFLI